MMCSSHCLFSVTFKKRLQNTRGNIEWKESMITARVVCSILQHKYSDTLLVVQNELLCSSTMGQNQLTIAITNLTTMNFACIVEH